MSTDVRTVHQAPATEARKFDDGKLRYDLIPPFALEDVVGVLTYGANKYGDWSWLKNGGMKWSRLFAATGRHLLRWWMGETFDPESKKHHLAHVACNVLFLLEYRAVRVGEDDRPYPELQDGTTEEDFSST